MSEFLLTVVKGFCVYSPSFPKKSESIRALPSPKTWETSLPNTMK